jgi:RHS repeat-associated protein
MPMPNKHTIDGNYRYAFQGQEKDGETDMEAFELRLWDGRLGRWLTVDPYHEFHSPYVGMGNNPISLIDPDGGSTDPCPDCPNGPQTNGTTWIGTDGGTYIYDDFYGGWSNGSEVVGTATINQNKSNSQAFATALMVRSTATFGAASVADGPLPFGEAVGGTQWILSAAASLAIVAPYVMSDDYTVTVSEPNENGYVTLYRGVHAKHPDFNNALRGTATPSALLPVGYTTPEEHNSSNGGIPSYFTSWTISKSVANFHAYKSYPYAGVVLMKRFKLTETVPSPDNYDEFEVLIPGIVTGAKVMIPNNTGTPTAF